VRGFPEDALVRLAAVVPSILVTIQQSLLFRFDQVIR
jgi:hypothetical protein